jgi:hypothetical protein
MATQTKSRRAPSAPRGRYARGTTARRRSSIRRARRRPQPTGLKKALGGILPGAAGKKAAPTSKKGAAGGLALVAAAGGMLFKNRDKLAQLRRKRSGSPATARDKTAPPAAPGGRASSGL